MFHGSIVALVTPMDEQGRIDENSLKKLVEIHIEEGTDAIVAVGTTGEAATLTESEQLRVISIIMEQAEHRIPIIAGTGSNSTAHTIALTQKAMHLGVDACLIVTPYYNKPTQEGLYQHYYAVANEVPIPIILYNVPSRTGCDLLPETIARLVDIPNIIAIKEATGKLERAKAIQDICQEKIDIFSGDDASALDLMLEASAKGVISVTANIAPRLMYEMCDAVLNGNQEKAQAINQKLMPLHKDLFIESNPIPTKWALNKMGLIKSGIRLPLTQLSESYHERVLNAMHQSGIS